MLIYLAALCGSVSILVWRTWSEPRAGMLAFLGFASVALPAIRWDILPLPAGGSAFLLGSIGIALGYTQLVRLRERPLRGVPLLSLPVLYLVCLATLVLLMILPSLLVTDPLPGLVKGARLMFRALLPVGALVLFGRLNPKEDTPSLTIMFVVAGALTALAILSSGTLLTAERASTDESANPITIARVIGAGASVAVVWAVLAAPPWGLLKRAGAALIALVLLFVTMLTGSRGPLLAAVGTGLLASMFLPSAAFTAGVRFRRLIGLAGVAVLVLVILSPWLALFGGFNRIADTLETLGRNRTEQARFEFYRRAWETLPEVALTGSGAATFVNAVNGRAGYPHNVEIELVYESGILGILAGGSLLALPALAILRRARRGGFTVDEIALTAVWGGALLNAQVSGSVATNTLLWVSGALVTLLDPAPPSRSDGLPEAGS